jgi:hypothetical protein
MTEGWRYPLYMLYSYYKRKGGWYPATFGGWTRSTSCIRVFKREKEAIEACPDDCEVVVVQLTFKIIRRL